MSNISTACCFPNHCPDYFQVWLKQRMIEFQEIFKALEYCFTGRIEHNDKKVQSASQIPQLTILYIKVEFVLDITFH